MTSLCITSNTFGIIFGYIFPSFLINEKDDKITYKNSMYNYLFWEMIISSVLCFPLLFFFKSKPKYPPR
jgi:hypothetical protein